MKILYDAYVSNGPNLETQDPATAGSLHFDNFSDLNNNKAVGGRIALQPITAVGIRLLDSIRKGRLDRLQGCRCPAAGGRFRLPQGVPRDLAARSTFTVNGSGPTSVAPPTTATGALGFGPVNFQELPQRRLRSGRLPPDRRQNKIIRNIEYIARFDVMTVPLERSRRRTRAAA